MPAVIVTVAVAVCVAAALLPHLVFAEGSGAAASPSVDVNASAALVGSPHHTPTATSDVCLACHTSHQGGDGKRAAGAPEDVAICGQCHDGSVSQAANVATGTADSFGLASGHSIPASAQAGDLVTGCTSCHAAHGSADTRPMIPGAVVNSETVDASGPQLCEACHDDSASWYRGTYPPTSAPTRDATGYPVAGTWPGPSVYAGATNAHRLIPETTQTVSAGETATAPVSRAQGDCLYCHAAHRGSNGYDGLTQTFRPTTPSTLASDQADGDYAAACFACHGGSLPSGASTPTADIKQFATAAQPGAGHRIVTAGGTLPVGAPMPCYDCHNPHGSARGNDAMLADDLGGSLETSSASGVRHFCFTCHATSDTATGWDSAARTFTAVAAEKVEGLPRDGAALKLPALPAHSEAATESCYDCHGDSYGAGGNNVHDPAVSGGFDAAEHTARSSSAVIALGLADADHVDTGTPVGISADCTLCHGNALLGIHAGRCATCHDSTRAAVTSAIASGTTACTACHAGAHAGVSHAAVYDAGGCDCHGLGATSGTGAVTQENCGACHAFAGVSDSTPPATTSDAIGTYVGPATVHLSATDLPLGGSHVAHTYYSLDGGLPVESRVVTIAAPSADSVAHTLQFWSVDGAGNAELPQLAAFTVSADTTAPTTTDDAQPAYWFGPPSADGAYRVYSPGVAQSAPLAISLAATDAATSGVADITYELDGGAPQAIAPMLASGAWRASVIVPPPTTPAESHTLLYSSTDYSGNAETTCSATFEAYLDETPPTTSVTVADGQVYAGAQSFTLSATDAGAGVAACFWRIDGGAWHSADGASASIDVAPPISGAETHTLDYYATDNVGNGEALAVAGAPSVTFAIGATSGADAVQPTAVPVAK